MQEVKAFNEQRAEIYWWLSSLFAKELTQADLDQYHTPEIRSFLSSLADNPCLKKPVDLLVDALNRLQSRTDAQLELSADFCELFLKSDKYGALPYASIYLDKSRLLNGEPAHQMQLLLEKHGIAVTTDLNEPADHLAIELDFLGNLIIRSNEIELEQHLNQALTEQGDFIEKHLLTWIEQFSQSCEKHDQFGFYFACSALLLEFCRLDLSYLQS